MSDQPIAIIDLGSNTFHILIAKMNGRTVQEIARKRIFVGLGDGGIEVIKAAPIKKGLEALEEFKSIMQKHDCSHFITIGTAALRSSKNSREFLDPAELLLGQDITIIDGAMEAKYIYEGVSLITDMSKGVSVIMDIGGGSTEFIVVNAGEVVWSKSYKLGVGVLHAAYHHTEPITPDAIAKMTEHVKETLSDLIETLKTVPKVSKLVGASGSFEVLESMNGLEIATHSNHLVSTNTCRQIAQKVINANYDERLKMDGLPIERTKLIVVAMVLIDVILDILDPEFIEVCPYALKEGVLASI